MTTAKVAISINQNLLKKLDLLVKGKVFTNRSQAIQVAVQEKIERMEHSRLARQCLKLEPHSEQAMAEEGFPRDMVEWPEY
ncbi:MAG: CopG family transcriptional regulator [Thermodesulfobacteriota bacterium]